MLLQASLPIPSLISQPWLLRSLIWAQPQLQAWLKGCRMKGQGWRMNGMLRATALPPKAHRAWLQGFWAEKELPRLFPGCQDKWPILPTLRMGFVLPSSPTAAPALPSQHTPGPAFDAKKGEKFPLFLYTHTLTCTRLKGYIKYINTQKLQFLLAALSCHSQTGQSSPRREFGDPRCQGWHCQGAVPGSHPVATEPGKDFQDHFTAGEGEKGVS